jgi:hypothetical protein
MQLAVVPSKSANVPALAGKSRVRLGGLSESRARRSVVFKLQCSCCVRAGCCSKLRLATFAARDCSLSFEQTSQRVVVRIEELRIVLIVCLTAQLTTQPHGGLTGG